MLKRLIATAALALGLASGASAQVLNYTAATDLSVLIGATHQFVEVPVSSTVRVGFRTDKNAADQTFAASREVLPPSTLTPLFSNFSIDLVSNDGRYSHRLERQNLTDFVSSSAGYECPSHVCDYVYNSGTMNTYNNIARNYYHPSAYGAAYPGTLQATVYWRSSESRYILDVRYRVSGPLGTLYTFYGDVNSHTCPSGYTWNSISATCDITDVEVAKQSKGDNICVLTAGWDILDVDCEKLKLDGIMTRGGTGGFNYSIRSSYGAVVSLSSGDSSSSIVSRVTTLTDGSGTARTDTTYGPTGIVGATNRTLYPSSPPPSYPSDSGGTAVPPGSTGGTSGGSSTTVSGCGGLNQPACQFNLSQLTEGTAQTNSLLQTSNSLLGELKAGACGGPGQPACAMQGLDGITSGLNDIKSAIQGQSLDLSPVNAGLAGVQGSVDALKASQCGGPGQPACQVSFGQSDENLDAKLFEHDPDSLLTPVKDRLSSFFSFTAPAHSSSCPALSFDVVAWGTHLTADNNFMCDFLEQYREILSTLAYLGFLFVAIRTILEA